MEIKDDIPDTLEAYTYTTYARKLALKQHSHHLFISTCQLYELCVCLNALYQEN